MTIMRLAAFALAACACPASAQERADMSGATYPELAAMPMADGDRVAGEASSTNNSRPAEVYLLHEGRRYLVRQENVRGEGSGQVLVVNVAEPVSADAGQERIVPIQSLLDKNRSPARR